MQEDLKKKNHHIIKSDEINQYLSLKCESYGHFKGDFTLVIYVKKIPLITIPSTLFSSLGYSFRDVEESVKSNKNHHRKNLVDYLYSKLLTNLIIWSENDYNTRFLDYKIAFPILKELRRVGDTKFQIILQQEILKEYASNSLPVKEFLKHKDYMKLICDFF